MSDKIDIDVLLAKEFKDTVDCTGYLMTTKVDGIRAVFVNGFLYTRNGHRIYAPETFTKDLPKDIIFDGELWLGNGTLHKMSGIARRKTIVPEDWVNVKYVVFDIIDDSLIYEERVKRYTKIISEINNENIVSLQFKVVNNNEQIYEELLEIEKDGGEGLMLRKPSSKYEHKRSSTLLKVKSFKDEEGIVTGYTDGEGRCAGSIGALLVKSPDNVIIKLGTGLTDEIRNNPPKIGAKVTYKYFEKSKDFVPRHAVFLTERTDV